MIDSSFQDAALLGAVFDAAVDAILVADRAGMIARANTAAEDLFGYDVGRLAGLSVNDLMPDAVALRHDGYMSHHLVTGDARIIGTGRKVDGKRKDGTLFPLHISVGRTDAEGEPIFIAILHDLTGRRVIEDALAQSQRMDALGQMTGGIAHDFNNLLTVIIGNLELLQSKVTGDDGQSMLADALEAATMGADLTARLTVFSRHGDLQTEAFDLNQGCERALAILKRTLGADYQIYVDLAADLPLIAVDPTQLQTAVVNLVLNARDAMPDGGKLTLQTQVAVIDDTRMPQEADVAQGAYVRLSITDTGDGMPPDVQRRAFEPFFTTKPPGKGTGLGLAMVYGFLRQSGGYITLQSHPGMGSTFALYFPILPDIAARSVADTTPRAVPLSCGDRTILIVDDNPLVRSLSVRRIRALGYRSFEAPDGDTAFAMLQSGLQVDLLFTDVVMPGMLSGYDLAIKVQEAFPTIKILLTSGYAANPDNSASVFAILQKPHGQAHLAETLQSILAGD